jgi:hypothetical protein
LKIAIPYYLTWRPLGLHHTLARRPIGGLVFHATRAIEVRMMTLEPVVFTV